MSSKTEEKKINWSEWLRNWSKNNKRPEDKIRVKKFFKGKKLKDLSFFELCEWLLSDFFRVTTFTLSYWSIFFSTFFFSSSYFALKWLTSFVNNTYLFFTVSLVFFIFSYGTPSNLVNFSIFSNVNLFCYFFFVICTRTPFFLTSFFIFFKKFYFSTLGLDYNLYCFFSYFKYCWCSVTTWASTRWTPSIVRSPYFKKIRN